MQHAISVQSAAPGPAGVVPRGRPCTVLDAMVLVAALALGLAWFRSLSPTHWVTVRSLGTATTTRALLAGIVAALESTLPFLTAGGLAVVVLRLLPRRPKFRAILRQPGFIACGVATLLVLAASAGALASGRVWNGPIVARVGRAQAIADLLFQTLADWSYLIGLAVAVAWIVLGVGRSWRPERGWIDRLGRLIGLAWIVLTPVAIALRVALVMGALI